MLILIFIHTDALYGTNIPLKMLPVTKPLRCTKYWNTEQPLPLRFQPYKKHYTT